MKSSDVQRILGVDPGTYQSGWLLWDIPTESVVQTGIDDNVLCQYTLFDPMTDPETQPPTIMALEDVGFQAKRVGQEVFTTCKWIGRFTERALSRHVPVLYMGRAGQINPVLIGVASGSVSDLWNALKHRYGDPGSKKHPGKLYGIRDHMRPALAVAVACMDMLRQGMLAENL